MSAKIQSLPSIDLSALPASLQESVRALLVLLQQLSLENQLLRSKMDLLVRRYFGGQKNESIPTEQLELLLQGFTTELLAAAPKSKPAVSDSAPSSRRPVRQGVPEHLPVRHTQTLIPAEVQAHPEHFREIDVTTTRILDYEPGRFVCDQIIRPRFVRKEPLLLPAPQASPGDTGVPTTSTVGPGEETEVLAAPLPNRLIEKGLPGAGLLVFLIVSRFEDHLPFYRLQKSFQQRHGVDLSRQTMTGWMDAVASWFEPLVGLIRKDLIGGGYLQVDETPIRYLDREEPGKSCTGYFWVYSRPGGDVVFDWNTSRGQEGPRKFLEGFSGKIQCDGYGVYPALAASNETWELHFCVAHWRRKFIEAKDEDRRAAWFVVQLRHLYEIERRLRMQRAGPRLREALRSAQARPIWERMKKAVALWESQALPQSRFGKALAYGKKLWDGLCRYVEHGNIEIDSNLVENSIRPSAIGKKNFLFVGHPDAGWKSAVMYSILGSCHRRRINPELYLKDVLTRLPDMKQSELKDYTPAAWAKRHPEARVVLPK